MKIIEVLRCSEDLKEKSFYYLVNRENPTLNKVLLFQDAVSKIKGRYVSLSEIYTKKSKKCVDLRLFSRKIATIQSCAKIVSLSSLQSK